jgi:cell division protein FtsB
MFFDQQQLNNNEMNFTPRTDKQANREITTDGIWIAHSRTLERELSTITAERDQLRAEVERLRAHTTACGVSELLDERRRAEARAERAEANETVALAQWNGALERAMKAEAELATERARRDDLVADINDACITLASAKDDCDDYALLNTGFKLTAVRDVLIQYIPNTAMKEDAK